MHEPVCVRADLHECAEVHKPYDGTLEAFTRHVFTRKVNDRLLNDLKYLKTRFLRLCERFDENSYRDTFDFHIHLYSGDALACSRHFEIHVSVMVFWSLNVSQNLVRLSIGHEADRK